MHRCAPVLFLLTLVPPVAAPAQEYVDPTAISRIKDEGLGRSQVDVLYNHLTNIVGARLTGSPAFKESIDWSAARLRQWGLSNVAIESWPFGRGWTLDKLTLELVEPRYFPLIGFPEAWTPSTRGELLVKAVYLGEMTADQIRASRAELAGAVILPVRPQSQFLVADRLQPTDHTEPVRIGAPPGVPATGAVDRRTMAALAREVGAGVILQPNYGQHGTVFVLGRRDTPPDAVPTVVLAAEHYNMIARLLQGGAPVRLRVNVQTRYHTADTSGYNVLAEIPGSDPQIGNEVVMVGAHIDSWHASTGATDNADAAAAVLEAARILKALDLKPRRTIRFALWGGEEQGLLGARAWVARHLAGDSNATARDRFSVYFNHDPGTGPIYGWYLQENSAAKPIFDAWIAQLQDVGARRNIIEAIGSTDHLPFIDAGVPGFNTLQDYVDYDKRSRHGNTDFYERVKPADLQQNAIVLATFAWHAAMRNEKIPRLVRP